MAGLKLGDRGLGYAGGNGQVGLLHSGPLAGAADLGADIVGRTLCTVCHTSIISPNRLTVKPDFATIPPMHPQVFYAAALAALMLGVLSWMASLARKDSVEKE